MSEWVEFNAPPDTIIIGHFGGGKVQAERSTRERTAYKVYRVLHSCASSYLGPFTYVADLPSRRGLRSSCSDCLVQPPVHRSTVGSRAFRWLALRCETACHRRLRLKTFLFTESYPNIRLIWYFCVSTLSIRDIAWLINWLIGHKVHRHTKSHTTSPFYSYSCDTGQFLLTLFSAVVRGPKTVGPRPWPSALSLITDLYWKKTSWLIDWMDWCDRSDLSDQID